MKCHSLSLLFFIFTHCQATPSDNPPVSDQPQPICSQSTCPRTALCIASPAILPLAAILGLAQGALCGGTLACCFTTQEAISSSNPGLRCAPVCCFPIFCLEGTFYGMAQGSYQSVKSTIDYIGGKGWKDPEKAFIAALQEMSRKTVNYAADILEYRE